MNVSRCRRLIVVLSVAYLEQDWCNSSFRYEPTPACLWEKGAGSSSPPAPCLSHREGLWRLLELSKKPIFIVFESQYREITHPAISLLKHHRSTVTLLVWRAGSMVRAKQGPTLVPHFISGSRSACSRPKCAQEGALL